MLRASVNHHGSDIQPDRIVGGAEECGVEHAKEIFALTDAVVHFQQERGDAGLHGQEPIAAQTRRAAGNLGAGDLEQGPQQIPAVAGMGP